ncbi:MAG: cytochrome b/b6 domain-containing protein [Ardenticatenaceae bacterium]|nr:cytochrome b/b6 domain-containing protein [Ardenticatenaceae bacterium]
MSNKTEQYPRFRLGARIEHAVLLISFTILAITGLPQKFATESWAQTMVRWMGGIELVRIIHHYSAFVLVLGSLFGVFVAAYRYYVRRERMPMFPTRKDYDDLVQFVRHNLGFTDEAPRMLKFNFGEKFEYWAVVWGTVLMTLTGFVMWNPIAFTAVFPGQLIPMAKAAHGGEAILAVSAIIVWHMYNVHIKHFNPSIFTGKMPRHQMEEEHALELERLESGGDPWPALEQPVLVHRQRIYFAFSLVIGAAILAVVVWAFTFEQTAITTVPRVTQEVFVPLATAVP